MSKISPQFAARLARRGPEDKVRAVLVLETGGTAKAGRQSPAERQGAIEKTQRAAEDALAAIDDILGRFAGRRLKATPDALGTLPVETTPAGLTALAACDRVKAILEDQAVSLFV